MVVPEWSVRYQQAVLTLPRDCFSDGTLAAPGPRRLPPEPGAGPRIRSRGGRAGPRARRHRPADEEGEGEEDGADEDEPAEDELQEALDDLNLFELLVGPEVVLCLVVFHVS